MKQVAKPWRPGDFQKGIQILWHTKGTDEEISKQASALLDYVVSTEANSVGITFSLYTDGVTPTKVYMGQETPSPHELALVIAATHERNLRIMLRPVIDEKNIAAERNNAWRGNIEPVNITNWFSSYNEALAPYLRLAQTSSVNEFVIGTELFSLETYTNEWRRTTHFAQQYFSGEISMAVNWDTIRYHPLPVKTIGLDMYPAVDLPDTASTAQLTRALRQWIEGSARKVKQPIVAQEVGIAGIPGAYKNPWYWGSGTADPRHFETQSRWFAASYAAAKEANLMGIYYWMVDSNQQFTREAITSQSAGGFIGRPAETAIRRSFAS